eukprot:TRINITY_DN8184_c0_g1_i3.p2 TRINITY_DN8184_c0_g1~~TRINITY_DN8184_c0_g1_i3.p2  ORF type:complete len:236 (+),score=59.28 TRINITY_DN8184_c0_g1_i3:978-1685(+)
MVRAYLRDRERSANAENKKGKADEKGKGKGKGGDDSSAEAAEGAEEAAEEAEKEAAEAEVEEKPQVELSPRRRPRDISGTWTGKAGEVYHVRRLCARTWETFCVKKSGKPFQQRSVYTIWYDHIFEAYWWGTRAVFFANARRKDDEEVLSWYSHEAHISKQPAFVWSRADEIPAEDPMPQTWSDEVDYLRRPVARMAWEWKQHHQQRAWSGREHRRSEASWTEVPPDDDWWQEWQ